jgi:hypothetical protein
MGSDGGARQLELSRGFRAGAFRFAVGAPTRELVDLVEELFCDLPPTEPTSRDEDLTVFELSPSPTAPNRYELEGPVIGPPGALPLAATVALLVTAVSRGSLDAEPGWLHLHAAGAVRDGRTAVLAAPRETGKTTTLATLVHRGWGFISDEAVAITADGDQLHGFAKPLSIKSRGRGLLSHLEARFLPRGEVAPDAVLHASLGPTGATAHPCAEPRLVCLLHRTGEAGTPAGQPWWRPMHPVDAVVALMGETMDAGRFGPEAVVTLARLATQSRCYEIGLGGPVDTAELIEQLFEQARPDPLPVEVMDDGTFVRPNVRSVLIGDRVVIHEQPEGRILALDQPGTQVWMKLGGWLPGLDIDLHGPVIAQFVQQLHAFGLIDLPPSDSAPGVRS